MRLFPSAHTPVSSQRPLRWWVAMLGVKVLELAIEGLTARAGAIGVMRAGRN